MIQKLNHFEGYECGSLLVCLHHQTNDHRASSMKKPLPHSIKVKDSFIITIIEKQRIQLVDRKGNAGSE